MVGHSSTIRDFFRSEKEVGMAENEAVERLRELRKPACIGKAARLGAEEVDEYGTLLLGLLLGFSFDGHPADDADNLQILTDLIASEKNAWPSIGLASPAKRRLGSGCVLPFTTARSVPVIAPTCSRFSGR
jgi:hypothetical protein